MSFTSLKDAATGNVQKIDSKQRAYAFATSESEEEGAVKNGSSWNLNTLDITLTSDSPSVTQYIKNTGTKTLYVQRWVLVAGPSTGGVDTDDCLIEIIRNPDSVSFSTSLQPFNSNFGSSRQPEADTFKGGEGETVSGGDVIIASRQADGGRNILPVFCSLPQGSSAAIRITPPSGNTNMKVQTVIVVYEGDD